MFQYTKLCLTIKSQKDITSLIEELKSELIFITISHWGKQVWGQKYKISLT